MTDREALRERVAKIYIDKWGLSDYWLADAAIDLAFEEAARVAQHISYEEVVRCRDALTEGDDEKAVRHADIAGSAASVAAALRAYIKETK